MTQYDVPQCPGGDCPLKDQCRRYVRDQSPVVLLGEPPYRDGECFLFVEIESEVSDSETPG